MGQFRFVKFAEGTIEKADQKPNFKPKNSIGLFKGKEKRENIQLNLNEMFLWMV